MHAAEKPVEILVTERGKFRLFVRTTLVRVMEVVRGRCYDFTTEEEALRWIKGDDSVQPIHEPEGL